MNGYDASMAGRPNYGAKTFGSMLGCGVVGMAAYYIPVDKNTFVDEAFSVLKKDTQAQMDVLTLCSDEIAKNKLTNKNKIFLNDHGVAETVDAVMDKCKELRDGITDNLKVKNIKEEFDANFQLYKKSAAARDNTVSKAMSNIKWARFGWGAGIGAVIGLALSMMNRN